MSTQQAFSAKFPKNRRFRLPWSTIELDNQRRRPNLTVAPHEVRLRFWFFAAGCRFLLHVLRFFLQTALDMNRENVFAIHRCINEGYGLIQIFTEKIRISPTKLLRVCSPHVLLQCNQHLQYICLDILFLNALAVQYSTSMHTIGSDDICN